MTRKLGIDIDGVIGDHRTMFAEILRRMSGKQVDADAILRIPVRDNPDLRVTQEDELRVFNRPEYWAEMQMYDGAARTIRNVRRSAGWQVHIFTRRPWPHMDALDPKALAAWDQWLPRPYAWLPQGSTRTRITRWLLSRGSVIRHLTRTWLRRNHAEWDRLVVEFASLVRPDSREEPDRFSVAGSESISVFVEDEVPKAIRLAGICEQVLLFDQPYNRETEGLLPSNVRRVKSWIEIESLM